MNNYKSRNNSPMKTKLHQYAMSVGMETTGLRKMLKLVSLRLETQADRTLHVCELCSQHVQKEMVRTGQASTRRSALLPNFITIGKLFIDL
jgi:hypothetical protein